MILEEKSIFEKLGIESAKIHRILDGCACPIEESSEYGPYPSILQKIYASRKEIDEAWQQYDYKDRTTHPTEYGKYFVHRAGGKMHYETYNGTGFAYNNTRITHWRRILPPVQK